MPPWDWEPWPRYVSVAERRESGARHAAKLARQGRALRPVVPAGRGRRLATTFWGRAWCDNLNAYASLLNRLDRGRSYLRNGLVIDLQIAPGAVKALVSGSDLYEVSVGIAPMTSGRWKSVVKACAGKIDSVVELLAGRLDDSVMAHVCRQGTGLFPTPAELEYACTCPDGSAGDWLCKHVAATLYGVGVRLDEDPEMLFRLRQVAHADLLARATAGLVAGAPAPGSGRRVIASDRVAAVFGIELEPAPASRPRRARGPKQSERQPAKRKRR
jgi:uncharacterized Zn finger protein